MANGDTVGAFVKGVARLSKYNDFSVDDTGTPVSTSSVYTVLLDRGVLATPANVEGLPEINSVHPFVENLRAESHNFICANENTGVWEVTVFYSRLPASTTEQDNRSKIKSRSWDVGSCSVDLTTDAETGEPVINAAGDPFDSVPQRTIYSPKVAFTRLETKHPGSVIQLNGTINAQAETVLGVTFPPHCATLKVSAKDTMDETAGALRYEYSYVIEGRNLFAKIGEQNVQIGWDEALIQAGYAFLFNGKKYKFLEEDENGEKREVSSPQLLNADGTRNTTNVPVVRRIVAAPVASWTSLKLPS